MNLTAGAPWESPKLRAQVPLGYIYMIFRGLNFESNEELGKKAIYGQILVGGVVCYLWNRSPRPPRTEPSSFVENPALFCGAASWIFPARREKGNDCSHT